MAAPDSNPRSSTVVRYPVPCYVDSVRWISSLSPLEKLFLVSSININTHTPSLDIYSISNDSNTNKPQITSSWTPPSRITSLASTPSLFAASTLSGTLHFFTTPFASELVPLATVGQADPSFHIESICSVGLRDGGGECCVTVGQDGGINVLALGEGNAVSRKVFDGSGLVSYTSVTWASGHEFVTGGVGVGLQWWDMRHCGRPVSQLKEIWNKGKASGIVHSVDVHPSRKHACLAGGSSGTVLAWDLRWPRQPVFLASHNNGERSVSSSDIWEVQFTKSCSSYASSSQLLPAMVCSEDGILAVLEQGKEATELLAEPCAINSFDIHWSNSLDIVCCLEWESIALLCR